MKTGLLFSRFRRCLLQACIQFTASCHPRSRRHDVPEPTATVKEALIAYSRASLNRPSSLRSSATARSGEELMSRHVFVLVAVLASSGAYAQQSRQVSAPAMEVEHTSRESVASSPPRDTRAPKSLMGMVMGAMIQSAEQSARRDRERAVPRSAATRASSIPPERLRTMPASRDQVAVQLDP